VELIKELFKNMRKKLLNLEKLHSNMHGLWINLKVRDKEVSPLISHFGSSSLQNITSPLLMPLVTETS
jgi:hypothetical protein